MTTGRKVTLGILLAIVLTIAYVYYSISTNLDAQPGEIIDAPSQAYLSIFPANERRKIIAEYVVKPKYGNLVCQYSYDEKKYEIEEYVIDATVDQPLNEFIDIKFKDALKPDFSWNGEIRRESSTTRYKSIFPKASHLSVNLYGDSIKTILQNDTIKSFSFLCKNFSIKCNGSDTSALYRVAQPYYDTDKPVTSLLPVDIMFIKRKKAIYLLLMSPSDKKTYLAPNMLNNLIIGD